MWHGVCVYTSEIQLVFTPNIFRLVWSQYLSCCTIHAVCSSSLVVAFGPIAIRCRSVCCACISCCIFMEQSVKHITQPVYRRCSIHICLGPYGVGHLPWLQKRTDIWSLFWNANVWLKFTQFLFWTLQWMCWFFSLEMVFVWGMVSFSCCECDFH